MISTWTSKSTSQCLRCSTRTIRVRSTLSRFTNLSINLTRLNGRLTVDWEQGMCQWTLDLVEIPTRLMGGVTWMRVKPLTRHPPPTLEAASLPWRNQPTIRLKVCRSSLPTWMQVTYFAWISSTFSERQKPSNDGWSLANEGKSMAVTDTVAFRRNKLWKCATNTEGTWLWPFETAGTGYFSKRKNNPQIWWIHKYREGLLHG